MASRNYNAALNGTWTRPGWSPLTATSRRTDYSSPTFVATAANTGTLTSEAILSDGSHDYNSDVNTVTIPDGAVIISKRIFGDITFAGSAILADCLLVGGNQAITTGNIGVLSCVEVRTGIAKLADCTIRVRKDSDGRDGALGMQFELERVRIIGGVDGVGIYNKYGTDANVKVKGCLIEDRAYTYPDRDHSDGTHSDPIQIQGGRYIEVIGNTCDGQGHYMTGSGTYYDTHPSTDAGDWPLLMTVPHTPGSGIIINGNVAAVDSTVILDNNLIKNCKIMLNVGTQANGFQCTNNRFSTVDGPAKNVSGTVRNGVTLTFTANEYWIRLANQNTYNNNIIGLVTAGVITNTTNVFYDGPNAGVALTTPRASGINDNAQA